MATVEVSTWSQLVTALSTSVQESKTIKLMNDIDCNDEIPTGVGSTITCYGSPGYMTTVDGSYDEDGVTKNHVIRNLRTNVSTPVNIFNIKNNGSSGNTRPCGITFKNIDFINLILMGGALIGVYDDSIIGGDRININKCRFVGRRNRFLFNGKAESGLTDDDTIFQMTSCFFNIPYFPTTTENTYVPLIGEWTGTRTYIRAQFCWFRHSYNGWDVPNNNGYHTYTRYMQMNGCYNDGEIVGSNALTITQKYDYVAPIQNVVDCTIKLLNGSNTSTIYAPKGIWRDHVVDYNNPSTQYTDCVNGNSNLAIKVTPESNMTNPTWLAQNGFDIVVP